MNTIGISTTIADGGEYAQAVESAGGVPLLLDFHNLESLDAQLDGSAAVLLSGGGDVDPRHYGGVRKLAAGIDAQRDAFELALVRRARERGLPTLCICRGLQVANVAFGGTLIVDIGVSFNAPTAALHCSDVHGKTERGLIAGHDVAIRPNSLLATIVRKSPTVTSSRHHQSIALVAGDLHVVASTPDGVVEAAEARFPSPFWLGVQWHPESTLAVDEGASCAIFAAFIAAADRFRKARRTSRDEGASQVG